MIKITKYCHKSTPMAHKYLKDAETKIVDNLDELSDFIATYDWSPGIFKESKRNINNFISSDLLVFDFDEGPDLEIMESKLKEYQYVIGLTKSHRKNKVVNGTPIKCDRYRIALVPERRIDTVTDYYATYTHYLNELFPTADKACKDPSRFYYGCTSVYKVQSEGRTLPVMVGKEEVKKPAKHTLSFTYKGNISRTTRDFLEEGHSEAWNQELFKACRDIKEQGYSMEECREMITLPTKLDRPGYLGYLDDKDIKTLESAYATESKYSPRLTGANAKADSVINLIDKNYKLQSLSTGQNWYFKYDSETKELARMDKSEGFYDQIRRLAWDDMPGLSVKQIEKLLETWRLRTDVLAEDPKPVAFADQDVYCFKKLDFSPAPGKWDAWEDFTSRLSDPGFFMAYVWSCFEEKYQGRQFAWITSPGGDGKSTVLRVLKDILGNAAEAVSDSVTLSKSDFVYSSFYGKKVAIYADCKNHRFAESTLIRNITGNDYVSIQFKGKDAFSARLHLRVFVGSNIEPTFSGDRADTSRCIPLRLTPLLKKPSNLYEDALRSQIGAFLWECKQKYKVLCTDNVVIETSRATFALQGEAIIERYEEQDAVFKKYFDVDEHGTVPGHVVLTLMKDKEKFTNWQMKDFKAYMSHFHNVKCIDMSGRRVYTNIKLKDSEFK